MVTANWKKFIPVFCDEGKKLTRADLKNMFRPSYSAEGSNLKELEEDTVFYFEEWLVAVEGKPIHIFQSKRIFETCILHVLCHLFFMCNNRLFVWMCRLWLAVNVYKII